MNVTEKVFGNNHKVYIQDKEVLALCEKFGTPLYLYDLNTVVRRYTDLYKYIKWPKLRIYYAMKANYNIDILKTLKNNGAYLDTVSPAEVILALKLGYGKDRILFTANNMTDEEMHIIKNLGILFNIDSISRLASYAEKFPGSEVCLRFNPDVIAGENEKVQTAGDSTKFGILLDDVPIVRKIMVRYNLKVIGLHEHTGSGISEVESVYQGMQKLRLSPVRRIFLIYDLLILEEDLKYHIIPMITDLIIVHLGVKLLKYLKSIVRNMDEFYLYILSPENIL